MDPGLGTQASMFGTSYSVKREIARSLEANIVHDMFHFPASAASPNRSFSGHARRFHTPGNPRKSATNRKNFPTRTYLDKMRAGSISTEPKVER
ncbi:hypothetical protein [Sphingomonas sp.]|uniref:hypothetical protein n=1 Tax=Sphingomonas sp. TaxID=28214 RepID=UPI0031D2F453